MEHVTLLISPVPVFMARLSNSFSRLRYHPQCLGIDPEAHILKKRREIRSSPLGVDTERVNMSLKG